MAYVYWVGITAVHTPLPSSPLHLRKRGGEGKGGGGGCRIDRRQFYAILWHSGIGSTRATSLHYLRSSPFAASPCDLGRGSPFPFLSSFQVLYTRDEYRVGGGTNGDAMGDNKKQNVWMSGLKPRALPLPPLVLLSLILIWVRMLPLPLPLLR